MSLGFFFHLHLSQRIPIATYKFYHSLILYSTCQSQVHGRFRHRLNAFHFIVFCAIGLQNAASLLFRML